MLAAFTLLACAPLLPKMYAFPIDNFFKKNPFRSSIILKLRNLFLTNSSWNPGREARYSNRTGTNTSSVWCRGNRDHLCGDPPVGGSWQHFIVRANWFPSRAPSYPGGMHGHFLFLLKGRCSSPLPILRLKNSLGGTGLLSLRAGDFVKIPQPNLL